MATIYKPTYTTTDKRGRKVTKKAKCWYIRYRDAAGRLRQVKEHTDKEATKSKAMKLEKGSERQQEGMVDREQHRRPMAEHLAAYQAFLEKKNSDVHVEGTMQRVRRILRVARVETWQNITPANIEDALSDIVAADNLAPQTRNYYLTACNMFCNWMAEQNRASENPIKDLKHLEIEDREHRRALDPDEAAYLFAAAQAGKPMSGRDRSGNVRWEMTGPARAALYRLACDTALRRGALERLEVGDIDTGPDPKVVVRGTPNTKEKRRRTIPLRRSTADILHQHLADKLPAAKAFDMPAKWETADMLRADLEGARAAWIAEGPTAEDRAKRARDDFLAAVDAEGRRLDFHALRTTCATWLDQVGVAPSLAKRVTGHRSERVLSDSYHRQTERATRHAVEALPVVEMAATGTVGQDTKKTTTSCLAPQLAPDVGSSCHSVASDGTIDTTCTDGGDDSKSLEMSTLGNDCHDMAQAPPAGLEPATCGLRVRGQGRKTPRKMAFLEIAQRLAQRAAQKTTPPTRTWRPSWTLGRRCLARSAPASWRRSRRPAAGNDPAAGHG